MDNDSPASSAILAIEPDIGCWPALKDALVEAFGCSEVILVASLAAGLERLAGAGACDAVVVADSFGSDDVAAFVDEAKWIWGGLDAAFLQSSRDGDRPAPSEPPLFGAGGYAFDICPPLL